MRIILGTFTPLITTGAFLILYVFSQNLYASTPGTNSGSIVYFENAPRLDTLPVVTAQPETIASPTPTLGDYLPLAPDTSGFSRPVFPTIHLGISLGIIFCDFSSLKPLQVNKSNVTYPIAVNVHIPIWEEPAISLISGYGLSFDGNRGGVFSMSTCILYQTRMVSTLDVIFGTGIGQTKFNYDGSIILHSTQNYPVVMCGVNLARNYLYLMFTYPITKPLQTTFEGKLYKLTLTGPGLSLVFSLR